MPNLRLPRRALLAGAAALAAPSVRAQAAWPDRPVRIIAPFAPGGTADTLGRLISQDLQQSFGQPFVVENRPGAGGLIGSAMVARAAPDGHTFVISGIASHVIAPATAANPEFHPLRDFTHVAFLGGPPTVLIVANSVPAQNLAEFVALARSGHRFAFGSPGVGTHGHLFGVAIAQAAGIELEHIPYRGGANALSDIMGGSLPVGSFALTSAAPGIRGGRVRPLALTGTRRATAFPDIPTFAELGYPTLTGQTWFGLSGPANLPPAIAQRLNAEVVRILGLPHIRERLTAEAIDVAPFDVAGFTAFIGEEITRWGAIARAAGLTPG
jgi:tripartite-type tricarboxylate transporter receptor subunit TctC